jgi:hypothetical protein
MGAIYTEYRAAFPAWTIGAFSMHPLGPAARQVLTMA